MVSTAIASGGRQVNKVDLDKVTKQAVIALSATPRPFLKWAGSKRALLPQIIPALPSAYRTYHEPFLGSGSLFFLLQPDHAYLSDTCRELIDTFQAVRDNPHAVLRHLKPWKPDREFFYAVRSNRSRGRLKRAAEFIYLNHTCWNGLYRVNSRGMFNVPYGLPRTDHVVDRVNVLACGRALAPDGVVLGCRDFDAALRVVCRDDLVFLDPPYVTGHNNNGFIDYNERLFSWADQVRLAKAARSLVRRGAHVIVTNAYHDDIVDLYADFNLATISRASTLAANPEKRGRVSEALFWMHGSETRDG